MVKLIYDRFNRGFNVSKVDDPTVWFYDGTADYHPHLVRVSVDASALMALGHVWQTMGSFEFEFFVNVHGVLF